MDDLGAEEVRGAASGFQIQSILQAIQKQKNRSNLKPEEAGDRKGTHNEETWDLLASPKKKLAERWEQVSPSVKQTLERYSPRRFKGWFSEDQTRDENDAVMEACTAAKIPHQMVADRKSRYQQIAEFCLGDVPAELNKGPTTSQTNSYLPHSDPEPIISSPDHLVPSCIQNKVLNTAYSSTVHIRYETFSNQDVEAPSIDCWSKKCKPTKNVENCDKKYATIVARKIAKIEAENIVNKIVFNAENAVIDIEKNRNSNGNHESLSMMSTDVNNLFNKEMTENPLESAIFEVSDNVQLKREKLLETDFPLAKIPEEIKQKPVKKVRIFSETIENIPLETCDLENQGTKDKTEGSKTDEPIKNTLEEIFMPVSPLDIVGPSEGCPPDNGKPFQCTPDIVNHPEGGTPRPPDITGPSQTCTSRPPRFAGPPLACTPQPDIVGPPEASTPKLPDIVGPPGACTPQPVIVRSPEACTPKLPDIVGPPGACTPQPVIVGSPEACSPNLPDIMGTPGACTPRTRPTTLHPPPPDPDGGLKRKSPVTVQEWVDHLPVKPITIPEIRTEEPVLDPGLLRCQATSRLSREPSVQSSSSLDSLLDSRKPDPVEVLLNLGFGGVPGIDLDNCRIPKRFLIPSKCKGGDWEEFLRRELLQVQNFECSTLGFRGLSGQNHQRPSAIVANIMEKLRERNCPRPVPRPITRFTSVAKRVLSETSVLNKLSVHTSQASVLTPDNRKFLESQGKISPEVPRRRIIFGEKSFAISKDGELMEEEPRRVKTTSSNAAPSAGSWSGGSGSGVDLDIETDPEDLDVRSELVMAPSAADILRMRRSSLQRQRRIEAEEEDCDGPAQPHRFDAVAENGEDLRDALAAEIETLSRRIQSAAPEDLVAILQPIKELRGKLTDV